MVTITISADDLYEHLSNGALKVTEFHYSNNGYGSPRMDVEFDVTEDYVLDDDLSIERAEYDEVCNELETLKKQVEELEELLQQKNDALEKAIDELHSKITEQPLHKKILSFIYTK